MTFAAGSLGMALIKCSECGREVSSQAKTCPHCGHARPKKTSVLTWSIAGFFLLTIIMGAINSQKTQDATAAVTPAQRAAKTAQAIKDHDLCDMSVPSHETTIDVEAYEDAKSEIEPRLKAPATAQWHHVTSKVPGPASDVPGYKLIAAKADAAHICVFGVDLTVDAQNSFGALIRNEYLSKVWLYKEKDSGTTSGGWVRYTSDIVPVR
jgi:ribosomal protein L37E